MEQQKRQRLQRQKEISHNLYQRSTSESLPDEAGGGAVQAGLKDNTA